MESLVHQSDDNKCIGKKNLLVKCYGSQIWTLYGNLSQLGKHFFHIKRVFEHLKNWSKNWIDWILMQCQMQVVLYVTENQTFILEGVGGGQMKLHIEPSQNYLIHF